MGHAANVYEFKISVVAEKIFLADRVGTAPAAIVHLTESEPGNWQTRLKLHPGEHRLRYYCVNGRAVTYLGPAEIAGCETDGWDAVVKVPPETAHESHGFDAARAYRLLAANGAGLA